MAAPTGHDFDTPIAPAGKPLERGGVGCRIHFANIGVNPKFWVKAITPPAMDGGDAIDISTQHNVAWRTRVPRILKDLEPFDITASYDPDNYDSDTSALLQGQINVATTITILFVDGSTLAFFGYIKRVEPSEMSEDADQPEITINVVPTNWDYANDVEAGPVMVEVSGT